jgi:hypothetical protein
MIGAAKRKGHGPVFNAVDVIDGIQEDGGVLLGETDIEEDDAGYRGWGGLLQGLDGQAGDFRGAQLRGTVDAFHYHGKLARGLLEQDITLFYILAGDGHDPLLDSGDDLGVLDLFDDDLGLIPRP